MDLTWHIESKWTGSGDRYVLDVQLCTNNNFHYAEIRKSLILHTQELTYAVMRLAYMEALPTRGIPVQ